MFKSVHGVMLLSTLLMMIPVSLPAADRDAMKEDNQHIRRWNGFAEKLLRLHDRLTRQQPHTVTERLGGYAHMENFYREFKYTNKKTGKLTSLVAWEKAYPDNLHTIEVYLYDEYGRVTRDYSAAYLPAYRNAPTQTLISFHVYNGLLHAFRTFDASGDHILDRCTGRYNAKEINILLDDDDLYEGRFQKKGVMQSDTYRECFKGLPDKAGKYLDPQ